MLTKVIQIKLKVMEHDSYIKNRKYNYVIPNSCPNNTHLEQQQRQGEKQKIITMLIIIIILTIEQGKTITKFMIRVKLDMLFLNAFSLDSAKI